MRLEVLRLEFFLKVGLTYIDDRYLLKVCINKLRILIRSKRRLRYVGEK
jgi:hypothetical protein